MYEMPVPCYLVITFIYGTLFRIMLQGRIYTYAFMNVWIYTCIYECIHGNHPHLSSFL